MSNKEPFFSMNIENSLDNNYQEIDKVFENYTFSTICDNLGFLLSQHHNPGIEELDNLDMKMDLILEMFGSSSDIAEHPFSLNKYSVAENFISKYSKIS